MTKLRFQKAGGFFLLAMLFGLPLQAQKHGGLTTVILVRHAEKDTNGTNPPLTERGLERARALDRELGDTRVSAVYVTQYLRTQQTAHVVAVHDSAEPKVFDVNLSKPRQSGEAVAKDILRNCRGGTILVASHSNVIPFIIDALGGGWIGNLDERSYDNLFIVVRRSSGEVRLLRMKYGAPSN